MCSHEVISLKYEWNAISATFLYQSRAASLEQNGVRHIDLQAYF